MKRGFALVAALLTLSLLLVLGLAFMTLSGLHYQREQDVLLQAQAQQLALAGLEEARLKLNLDANFPPPLDKGQNAFSYAELVYDLDDTTVLGSYRVTLYMTYALDPQRVILIESAGYPGTGLETSNVRPRSLVTAEVDVSPTVRGSTAPNPNYWKILRTSEQSRP